MPIEPCETEDEAWEAADVPEPDAVPAPVEAETEAWAPGDEAPATPAPRPRKRGRLLEPPKGNTKLAEQAERRRQVILEAQGRSESAESGELWRENLAEGQRWRAADALSSDDLTHGSGSGFGLA